VEGTEPGGALDGKVLLVTNATDLTAPEVVNRYKALADIERDFGRDFGRYRAAGHNLHRWISTCPFLKRVFILPIPDRLGRGALLAGSAGSWTPHPAAPL